MDWWKVAAVTGAGYAAKYLQKFSRDREGLSAERPDPSSSIQRIHERDLLDDSLQRTDQVPSFEKGDGSHSDGRCWGRTRGNSRFEGNYCDNLNDACEASTCGMGNIQVPRRRRSSLKSRSSNLKPINSLESCLMAQLYKECSEMEEPVLVPQPSPCTPALRPFVVTDGTQIISRLNYGSCNVHVEDGKDRVHKDVYPEENEACFGGFFPSPGMRLEGVSREKNLKRKNQTRKPWSAHGKPNETQISSQGSPPAAVLFCLGVSVGIISSILAAKTEVTKLNDLLKQTESLVQDLHEELEMKDSIIVRELANEAYVSPCTSEKNADKKIPTETQVYSDSGSEVLTKYVVGVSDTQKATEAVESISVIEAELEAELERLELNMKNSSSHEISVDDELDPDLVAEVVQGDLRADTLSFRPSSDPSLNYTSSNTSTPNSPNRAVSPRELSLRLHQIIQTRLEQRVRELESALEDSRKRIAILQSEKQLNRSWSGFSHTDASFSSSTQGSPAMAATPVNPLVMNLVGDALDAYGEARGELEKMKEGIEKENGEDPKSEMFLLEESEDGDDDDDDDMSLLIKQIVEKTRQGSPAVLQARKAMFFLDKDED